MRRGMADVDVATAHGVFNVVSGVWPLLHMRSFEAVSGPKTDRWLVRTVSGLLLTVGSAQLRAAPDPRALELARTVGIGTALTMLLIDLRYGLPGRISRVYLLDAAVEAGWLLAWARAARRVEPTPAGG